MNPSPWTEKKMWRVVAYLTHCKQASRTLAMPKREADYCRARLVAVSLADQLRRDRYRLEDTALKKHAQPQPIVAAMDRKLDDEAA